jgi:hypothetical protein
MLDCPDRDAAMRHGPATFQRCHSIGGTQVRFFDDRHCLVAARKRYRRRDDWNQMHKVPQSIG